jgi:hypothetical protein
MTLECPDENRVMSGGRSLTQTNEGRYWTASASTNDGLLAGDEAEQRAEPRQSDQATGTVTVGKCERIIVLVGA